MLSNSERAEIIALMKREIVPAIGCTEPAAVALCVARATETLGSLPEKITVRLSPNMLKNAMGVGIPATGMTGLPIAVALGATIGRSEYGLEVLRDTTPEAVGRGKAYIAENRIDIGLKENTVEKLYIEVEVSCGVDTATAVIAGAHTRFVHISRNNIVLSQVSPAEGAPADEHSDTVELSLRRVWDFAMTAPVDEIRFILDSKRLNMAAAETSLAGSYGHRLGRIVGTDKRNMLGDGIFTRMLSCTSAACDARMAGAMIPVMSNSGSGNQGIAATVPVAVYADSCNADEERTVRALTLSHLTAIYIKQLLGRLSALCGCVVAATGSSCGITYLMGGGYDEVSYAVKNMIANLTGMICDGAKPSCALKLSSGVSTAMLSAVLAMEHECVSSVEGIIDDDVDRCIRNLTTIGRDGMNETDRLILQIMTSKC